MLRVTLRGSSVPAVTLGSGETLLFGRSPGLPAADPHVQLRRHVLALPNCARHISRLLGELAVADDVVRLRWRRTTEAQLSSLFDAPGGARRVTLVKGMSALLDEGENHIVVLRGWSTGPDEYADIVLSVDVAQVVPADEPVIDGDLSDPDGAATGPAPTLEPRSREWYVALALGLALLAGLVPVTGAFEPRRLVDPPHRTLDEPSPLPRIAAWQQNGDVELLRVTGGGTRLRLVTLAEFTGANWSATATYRPLGAEASTALPPERNQVRLDATVIVAALDGPWLPSPGAPLATSVSSVDVEPESGSLALRDGLRPGLAYRISAVRDAPRADDVASAAVPAGATVQPYLRT